MESARFYVYALLDPRKPGQRKYGTWTFAAEPFYIGKGTGGRARGHLRAHPDNKSFCANKVRAIYSQGYQPVVVIKKYNLAEPEAFALEVQLIRIIGRADLKTGPLTNLTAGAEGAQKSALTRAKLSSKAKLQQQALSVVDRLVINERISVGTKAGRLAMSTEAKSQHVERLSSMLLSYWEGVPTEERKARIQKTIDRRELEVSEVSRRRKCKALRKHMLGVVALRENDPQRKAKHYAKVGTSVARSWDTLSAEDREARCKALRGPRPGVVPAIAKAVVISGVRYNSIAAASRVTGLSAYLIRKSICMELTQ